MQYEGAPAYFSVQLQLLEACNLKCAHCYGGDVLLSGTPPLEEIRRRIDAIYSLGAQLGVVPDIHLSGGEPTLRRDLVEIVRYIFDDKSGDALLFTNGTQWTSPFARALYDAGLRFVQVSLEGPEDLNDAIRGRGVYALAMQTLQMLREHGFRLTVSITVTAINFDSLFAFIESLDAPDVHVHLREVLPLGGGQRLPSLAPEQRRRLFKWAIGWAGASTVGVEDPIHCSVSPDYASGRRGCVAGRNHFCVDLDGVVYPCRPLRLAVGHVSDLRAAWDSPAMQRLRERKFGGRCGRCELLSNCGGCRAHALARGDAFGEDTRCFADELGLVRTPAEVRAVEFAERLGRGVWRARLAAGRLLGHGVTSRKDHSANGAT